MGRISEGCRPTCPRRSPCGRCGSLRGVEHAYASLRWTGSTIAIAWRSAQRRFRFLEVKCAGCDTCNTVELTTLRRSKETPIWQLERRMKCRPCSEERGYSYKRGHLVRLRKTNITIAEDGETWHPGEQRDRH
jgi:hypothetical protein